MSKVKLKSYIKAYFKLRQTYQHSQNNEKSLHVYDASLIVRSELVVCTHYPCIYTKHCGHLIIPRKRINPEFQRDRKGGGGVYVLGTIFNDAENEVRQLQLRNEKWRKIN